MITCKEGEIKPSVYFDHGKLFEVNHTRGELLRGSASEASDPAAEALRSSAQEEISKYARTALADGHGVVHAISESGGGVSLFIGISGFKHNPRNYWCVLRIPRTIPPIPCNANTHAVFVRAIAALLPHAQPPHSPAPISRSGP